MIIHDQNLLTKASVEFDFLLWISARFAYGFRFFLSRRVNSGDHRSRFFIAPPVKVALALCAKGTTTYIRIPRRQL